MDVQKIKQRFGIIGNSITLNRAIDIAKQVAPTDLSVLITGQSGTGKEVFPQIIHQFSSRKHGKYIPVNFHLALMILMRMINIQDMADLFGGETGIHNEVILRCHLIEKLLKWNSFPD